MGYIKTQMILKVLKMGKMEKLGIYLDSQFSWNIHIDNLCTTLARVSYLLHELKGCISNKMLVTTYYALKKNFFFKR